MPGDRPSGENPIGTRPDRDPEKSPRNVRGPEPPLPAWLQRNAPTPPSSAAALPAPAPRPGGAWPAPWVPGEGRIQIGPTWLRTVRCRSPTAFQPTGGHRCICSSCACSHHPTSSRISCQPTFSATASTRSIDAGPTSACSSRGLGDKGGDAEVVVRSPHAGSRGAPRPAPGLVGGPRSGCRRPGARRLPRPGCLRGLPGWSGALGSAAGPTAVTAPLLPCFRGLHRPACSSWPMRLHRPRPRSLRACARRRSHLDRSTSPAAGIVAQPLLVLTAGIRTTGHRHSPQALPGRRRPGSAAHHIPASLRSSAAVVAVPWRTFSNRRFSLGAWLRWSGAP